MNIQSTKVEPNKKFDNLIFCLLWEQNDCDDIRKVQFLISWKETSPDASCISNNTKKDGHVIFFSFSHKKGPSLQVHSYEKNAKNSCIFAIVLGKNSGGEKIFMIFPSSWYSSRKEKKWSSRSKCFWLGFWLFFGFFFRLQISHAREMCLDSVPLLPMRIFFSSRNFFFWCCRNERCLSVQSNWHVRKSLDFLRNVPQWWKFKWKEGCEIIWDVNFCKGGEIVKFPLWVSTSFLLQWQFFLSLLLFLLFFTLVGYLRP